MPIPAAPDPSADVVRRLLARHLPGWRATSVVPLGPVRWADSRARSTRRLGRDVDRPDPTTAEGAAARPRPGEGGAIRPSEGTAGQVGRADTSPGHRWAHGLAASRAAEARSTVLSSR